MRILLQRVSSASVSVDGSVIGAIERGYLLLLGVMKGDTEKQALMLADKVSQLRLFDSQDGPPDPNGIVRAGKINDRSLLDVGGSALVVSQFTLAGKTEKGNRPDYTGAEVPDVARILYTRFTDALRAAGITHVATGIFGAHMQVALVNDGPVTLLLER